ncbi:hypothetical protein PR202_ga11794 [Eleusine coracana subsp. coracana]|uniref:Uncharacterized protein n=1 Tax=Eleusine coracana subsp. coracana TaxID=191504 RepID=A0AAV5CAI0_ELECO|nr:hypothetical protein PR202_ga11794 [Eleusine coracana subsp. coracana]
MDLSCLATGFCDTLPIVQRVGLDITPPESWLLKNAVLVSMGSGRFCVAKFFDCVDDYNNPQVVVLTGVEVVPSDDHEREQSLCLFRRKSECLASDTIVCVL